MKKTITKTELTLFKKEHSKYFKLPDDFEEDFLSFFNPQFDGIHTFLKKEFKGGFKNEHNKDATDRVLKHWENLKLIPSNRSIEKGWRTYSYLDHVWTSIVLYLRRFGFPLDKIKKIKDDYLTQLKEYVGLEYPLLALFFAYSHSENDQVFLIVYDSGEAEITLRSDYLKVITDGVITDDYICINVSNIMNMIADTFPEKLDRKLNAQILNKKEEKLIGIFRNEDVSDLSVSKNSKANNITYITKVNPKDRALFKNLQGINYGKMDITLTDTKIVEVRVSKTERL